MEETILPPSPNWFLVSILAASEDGWLLYGGPGRTLVVLEPLTSEDDGAIDNDHRFRTHVLNKRHKEKIVSVNFSPEWPVKRNFVTGSINGEVREWNISQTDNKWTCRNIHSHEEHTKLKEELISVDYSLATHVVSVGSFSNIVLFELNTNVTKLYDNLMKSFKATCMSCSPHIPMVVAVGTKQGVVFVLDLTEKGSVIYKVRGQDDEISQVNWCPQYEVILKRALAEVVKKSSLDSRLEKIRNQSQPDKVEALEDSGIQKSLPDDSFDEFAIVQDDTFDIYKDHEANEFGHKKYEPEDITVKVKDDSKKDDFLVECEKLRARILMKKNEEEESIESLVEAMDNAHVDARKTEEEKKSSEGEAKAIVKPVLTGKATMAASGSSGAKHTAIDASAHVHRHLLASVGKQGSVRIWSKTGKVVASCILICTVNKPGHQSQQYVPKGPHYATVCWHKPDTLLICDGKTQVYECNPMKVDCRNKLHCQPVYSTHYRGLYCIATSAPRVQTAKLLADPNCDEEWNVWTAAQDRLVVKYSMKTRKVLVKYGTLGGYLYDIKQCPYDSGKFALAVGDGAIRVWETRTSETEDMKLEIGQTTCYWHNVQGKILQCAWHPTRENLLAFSTAESRVGLIDISKGQEKACKVLQSALSSAVYSLSWGENKTLFAAGGGELVMYQANMPDLLPIPIQIEIDGQKWSVSIVNYSRHGLMVGSTVGGVALFSGPGEHVLAAKFIFTKSVYAIEWHPQQTSDEESKYQNLVAICSVDKSYAIVILEYEEKEGTKQLSSYKTLTGHNHIVHQVHWSPHRDGILLSASHDNTVRVWDAIQGVCLSIFDGHLGSVMTASWCSQPQLANKVLSGSGDYSLRIWDINDYPAENYKVTVPGMKKEKKKKFAMRKKMIIGHVKREPKESDDENSNDKDGSENKNQADQEITDEEVVVLTVTQANWRIARSYLVPITTKQVSKFNVDPPTAVLTKFFEENKEIKKLMEIFKLEGVDFHNLDFFKLFGTINELNEVLDMECKSHLELKNYDGYFTLMIFRGQIDTVIQFANENNMLDNFLLSITPSVSFKYWKDAMQLYVAQIDRIAVQDPSLKHIERKSYGGPHYRKAVALLSVHDVRGAVDVLFNGKHFKEAYILCRCRHMDSVAEEALEKWAKETGYSGHLVLCAILNVTLGNVTRAASTLRRSQMQELLYLGAVLAKSAGLNTFADYIETKSKSARKEPITEDQAEELLEELPTRIQALMNENKLQTGELNEFAAEESSDSNSD